MNMKRLIFSMYFSVLLAIAFSQSAFAYLDPAATSYVIQIVVGIFIACGAVVGIYWKKIRLFFRKMKTNSLEKKLTKQADKNER